MKANEPRHVESKMDNHSKLTTTLASAAFHTFVILGELSVVYTIVRGINGWTTYAAFLLWLAGLLTFVYPQVGAHPRYAQWVWGNPRRSAMPWLVLFILLAVSVVRAGH